MIILNVKWNLVVLSTVHIVFILKKMSNTIQNYFLKRKLEKMDDNNHRHVDVDDEPMSLNTERLNSLSRSSKVSTYYSTVDDKIIKSVDFVSYMNRTLTDNEKLFVSIIVLN